MTNKKRTANSAQAQPEKGMRLCAERYEQWQFASTRDIKTTRVNFTLIR